MSIWLKTWIMFFWLAFKITSISFKVVVSLFKNTDIASCIQDVEINNLFCPIRA